MGILLGIIFWVGETSVFQIYHFLFHNNPENVSYETKLWLSLFPHTSFLFSCETLAALEMRNIGLTTDTLQEVQNQYTMLTSFGMNVYCSCIFLFLGIYLEQVLPKEYGSSQKWNYFCKCKQGKSDEVIQKEVNLQNIESFESKLEKELVEQERNSHFEDVGFLLDEKEQQGKTLNIYKLRKVYKNGKKLSGVNGISLKLYQGQIFVLLGQNGAGKTTLLQMLFGLTTPTNGNASMLGYDIQNSIHTIRQEIGICAQQDALFNSLTVVEHIQMFARLKGLKGKQISKRVKSLLKYLGLKAIQNDQIQNISTGQKRKLSVALAFAGNSKIIFLDEPSRGFDSESRRQLWTLVNNKKEKRFIVITTQSMDEADAIGDRIAIMSHGIIQTCGSSLFLKNRFIFNHILRAENSAKIATRQQFSQLKQLIQKLVPDAEIQTENSSQIIFTMPLEASNQFVKIYQKLSKQKSKYNIRSFEIKPKSMNQVFIEVSKRAEMQRKYEEDRKKDDEEEEENLSKILEEVEDDSKESEEKKHKIRMIKINDQLRVQNKNKSGANFRRQFSAIFYKKLKFTFRDKKSLCCGVCLPFLMLFLAAYVISLNAVVDSPQLVLKPEILPVPQIIPFAKPKKDVETSGIEDFFSLPTYQLENYTKDVTNTNTFSTFELEFFQKRNLRQRYGAYFINQTSVEANYLNYTCFVNTTAKDSAPYFLNRMAKAAIQKYGPNSKADLILRIDPFPLTFNQQQRDQNGGTNGVLMILFLGVAVSFISMVIEGFIVLEQETNFKYQQIISGLSLSSYWVSSFTFDLLMYLPFAISTPIVFAAFVTTSVQEGSNFMYTFCLTFFYGFANIIFCYFGSFFFKKTQTSQITVFIGSFFSSFVLPLLVLILKYSTKFRSFGNKCQWILRILLPGFCYSNGFLIMTNKNIEIQIHGSYDTTSPEFQSILSQTSIFSWKMGAPDLVFLLAQVGVYGYLIYVMEKYYNNVNDRNHFVKKENIKPKKKKITDLEDGVREQIEDIESEMTLADKKIKVKNLRKVYSTGFKTNRIALSKVTFSLQQGESLGILGAHGAGKTTILQLLTGQIKKTYGKIKIGDHELPNQLHSARKLIGYCPQGNPILDYLTGREHLHLIAVIKGIPANCLDFYIQTKIDEIGLTDVADNQVKTYSRGNKRKLTFTMALIGNPSIVLLDEPSNGMTPVDKKQLWDIIANLQNEKPPTTVILVTQFMDEAEILSNKVAIMTNGEFQMYQPLSHIEKKYGQGLQITIKIRDPTKSEILGMIVRSNKEKGDKIKYRQLDEVLAGLGALKYKTFLNKHSYGSHIYHKFKNEENVPIETIAQFVFYEKTGEQIYNFIKTNYKNCTIFSHFNSYFKFGLHSHSAPGLILGQLELNKKNLNINQYSIFKTTLERVFYYINRGHKVKVTKGENEMKNSKSLRRIRQRFMRVGTNISSNYTESSGTNTIFSQDKESFLSSLRQSSCSSFKTLNPLVRSSPAFKPKQSTLKSTGYKDPKQKKVFFQDKEQSIEPIAPIKEQSIEPIAPIEPINKSLEFELQIRPKGHSENVV